jgi:ribosomal 50S subunit-recycling heat shock protein
MIAETENFTGRIMRLVYSDGALQMRLDKFLKVSRIIKRRTVAKEFADNERVAVNGRIVKPGHEVKVGDIVCINIGARKTSVEILDIRDNVKAADAKGLYKILDS